MNGENKLDALKKLFSIKDSVDPMVNEAYKKRVSDSNNLIENFNFQATELIKQIERDTIVNTGELEPEFQEIEDKRKAIALYRTYEKILFYSDKTDVISESTTNTTLNKLVNEQIKSQKHIKAQNEKLSNDILELEFHHHDYTTLAEELKYLKQSKLEEVELLRNQVANTSENALLNELANQLNNKIKDSENFLIILDKLLEKVVLKYADFSNISVETAEDLGELKDFIYELIKNSIEGIYMNIDDLDKYQRGIIDNLVISNIIEVKGGGSEKAVSKLVKLRSFA